MPQGILATPAKAVWVPVAESFRHRATVHYRSPIIVGLSHEYLNPKLCCLDETTKSGPCVPKISWKMECGSRLVL
jgi:hypothetical protein